MEILLNFGKGFACGMGRYLWGLYAEYVGAIIWTLCTVLYLELMIIGLHLWEPYADKRSSEEIQRQRNISRAESSAEM